MEALLIQLRVVVARLQAYVDSLLIKVPPPQIPPPEMIPPTVPPITTASPYLWNNRANSRHSVRVICDEMGLSLYEKNVITACIQQESNFDNNAINHNTNVAGRVTSTDWGIVQCNDFYWIGAGKKFSSIKFVLDNPDKMVKWMCAMFKQGKLNLWVSYSSGAYKRYMPKNV